MAILLYEAAVLGLCLILLLIGLPDLALAGAIVLPILIMPFGFAKESQP